MPCILDLCVILVGASGRISGVRLCTLLGGYDCFEEHTASIFLRHGAL
jgi:hypothetical protein